MDVVERVKEDRLVRWSAYAAVPVAWLSLALMNPALLLVLPIIVFGLWRAMSYGMIERHPQDEPDFF